MIAKEEKITLDSDAALAIARAAEGGLRDAESALDQLISFRGEAITEADVTAVFGLVSRQTLEHLATAVLKGEVAEIIRIIGELDAGGKDMQRLVLELLDHFRTLLIYLCAPESAVTMDVIASQLEGLKQQAELAQPERLIRIAEVLSQAEDRMRYSLSRRTLVETALIRCAKTTTVSVDELLARLESVRQSLGGEGALPPPTSAAAHPDKAREAAPVSYAARPTATPPPAARAVAAPVRPAAPVVAKVNELEALTAAWRDQIVEQTRRIVALAGTALLDARPLAVEGDRVVIGFDPEFARKIEQMKIPNYHKAVQAALVRFLKRPVNVEFKLLATDGQADVPADHTVDKTSAPKVSAMPSAPGAQSVHPKSRQDWHQEPVVRKALELFNGSIVDIRE